MRIRFMLLSAGLVVRRLILRLLLSVLIVLRNPRKRILLMRMVLVRLRRSLLRPSVRRISLISSRVALVIRIVFCL